MKKAILYARISTPEQNLETQLADLRIMAAQRGYMVIAEYTDCISGAKAKRPGLDRLLFHARDHQFDAVFVAAFDRMARNVRHFLGVVDELQHLGIEFISRRENIDTTGPLGRAVILLISSLSEIERDLLKDRVKLGMRRARLEGRQIGRAPLNIDRAGLVRDRLAGMSLSAVARKYAVSRGTVVRLAKLAHQEYRDVGEHCSPEREIAAASFVA